MSLPALSRWACLRAVLFGMGALCACAPASAAMYVVTSSADAGAGSLRDILAQAQASPDAFSTVRFDAALDGATITLTTYTNPAGSSLVHAPPTSQFGAAAFFVGGHKSIDIDAMHTLSHGIVIRRDPTAPPFRLFDVDAGSALSLRGVTLLGGHALGGSSGYGGGALGAGGAIFNRGTLSIDSSTLADNIAEGGSVRSSLETTGGGGVGGDATGAVGGPPNGGTTTDLVGFGGGGRIPSDPPMFGGGGAGLGAPGSSGDAGGQGGFGAGGGAGTTPGSGGLFGAAGCAAGGGSGAGLGGAIFNDGGTVSVFNSTLTGNRALGGANERCANSDPGGTHWGQASGGGIFNYSGRVSVVASTLAGNAVTWGMPTGLSGANNGGAIYQVGDYACAGGGNLCGRAAAILSVRNALVAANTGDDNDGQAASQAHDDIVAAQLDGISPSGVALSSGDGNFIGHQQGFGGSWLVTGQSAQLGTLGDHGGYAWTRVPAATSPAVDRIDPADCASTPTDERGIVRPQGDRCDIGAVEYRSPPVLRVTVIGGGMVSAGDTPAPVSGGISGCTAAGGEACAAVYAGEGESLQTATLTAVAQGGAQFLGWSGACSGGAMTASVVLNGELSCAASFTDSPVYAVSAGVLGGHGSVTPTSVNVTAGSTAQVNVLPDPGYRVDSVTGTCGGVFDPGSNQFTTSPVAANCTVQASFTAIMHEVVATASAGGAVAPAQQSVAEGAAASLAVSPAPGYHVDTIGGTCAAGALAGTDYTTGTVTADCTVTFAFAADLFSVTASAGSNGSISPASQTVAAGGTASFTVIADAGYHVAGVSGDTCTFAAPIGSTWTTTAIGADCAVQAVFAADPVAALSVSVCRWAADGRCMDEPGYVAYGSDQVYVVTARNAGDAGAPDVAVSATSVGLDAGVTSWLCVAPGSALCSASGSGALSDAPVTIPAGEAISWIVATRVSGNAPEATLDYDVTLSRLFDPTGDPLTAVQSDELVIFRDGFDSAASGGVHVFDPAWSGEGEIALSTDAGAAAGLRDIVEAVAADGSGFALEQLDMGMSRWLRLRRVGDADTDSSAWVEWPPGLELRLRVVRDGGVAAAVVDGAVQPLVLALASATETWALRAADDMEVHR